MKNLWIPAFGSFFQESAEMTSRVIFPAAETVAIKFHDLPEGSVRARLLTPVDFEPRAEPYLIEIPTNKNVPSHFFIYKAKRLAMCCRGNCN